MTIEEDFSTYKWNLHNYRKDRVKWSEGLRISRTFTMFGRPKTMEISICTWIV